MKNSTFVKHRTIWVYGICLALLLALLKWVELKFVIYTHAFEVYAGVLAFVFTLLGVWLSRKLTKPKVEQVIMERPVYRDHSIPFEPDEHSMESSGISQRELEVLVAMAQGLSNQEIADSLFVSLNTVKTHIARIFEKLEVKRRTQAIEKAKELGLIR